MGATALVVGTIFSAGSAIGSGVSKKREAEYSAAVLDQEAGQQVATGIQGMLIERRRKESVASAAQAGLAASGATSTDPSAVKVRGQIEGAGEYQALTKLYEGEDAANQLRARGTILRSEGSAAQSAGFINAASTVLSGYGSWYDKYSGAN